MFSLYFELGIHHILDIHSYDHILFLICLTAVYMIYQWKQVLILITAFTIGHTISLVLATFKIISFSSALIEFLIPLTIFITGFWNVTSFKNNKIEYRTHVVKYFTALIFGLVHGLGFSNYLQSLLLNEKDIAIALLAFNIGIEVGQIFVVAIIMILNVFMINVLNLNRKDWVQIFSGAGMGIALTLMLERPFW